MKKRIKQTFDKIFKKIKAFATKTTAPIRKTRVWKFLRKYVLRSPFRGYFINSWREVRKVKWPDRKTSWKLTLVVVAFSLVFAIFTAALDIGFEKLAKQIFLK